MCLPLTCCYDCDKCVVIENPIEIDHFLPDSGADSSYFYLDYYHRATTEHLSKAVPFYRAGNLTKFKLGGSSVWNQLQQYLTYSHYTNK